MTLFGHKTRSGNNLNAFLDLKFRTPLLRPAQRPAEDPG